VVMSCHGGTRGTPKDWSDINRGACPSSGSGLKPLARTCCWGTAQLEVKPGSIVNKAIQVRRIVNHDVRRAIYVPVN